MLVIPRYVVTACETDYYILVVFVVMSKEEGSMYRERLHIPVVLGRMSTSSNSVESSNKRYSHQFRGICICLACTPPAYQGQVPSHHATQLALSRAFQLMRGVAKPML